MGLKERRISFTLLIFFVVLILVGDEGVGKRVSKEGDGCFSV